MKSTTRSKNSTGGVRGAVFIAAASLILLQAKPVWAAITWGSPTEISDDFDVDTAGTLVGALDIAQGIPDPTVNGVPFAQYNPPPPGESDSVGPFTFDLSAAVTAQTVANYAPFAGPFSDLSSSYQQILGSFDTIAPTWTLTMGGLTLGDQYAFQWWSNQSAAFGAFGDPGNFQLTATDTNSVTLNSDPSGALGGLGQFVIGTFTADSATETVTFSSPFSSPGGGPIDALQLRDIGPASTVVPEPSSFAIMCVGVLGFWGCGLSRRGTCCLLRVRRLPTHRPRRFRVARPCSTAAPGCDLIGE